MDLNSLLIIRQGRIWYASAGAEDWDAGGGRNHRIAAIVKFTEEWLSGQSKTLVEGAVSQLCPGAKIKISSALCLEMASYLELGGEA